MWTQSTARDAALPLLSVERGMREVCVGAHSPLTMCCVASLARSELSG